ncbi:MAG: hypothetical protein ACLP9L_15040 [Thermoguttaceae bacterium]
MIRRVVSLSIVALFALSAIPAWGEDAVSKIPAPPVAPAGAAAPASTTEADLVHRVAALEKQVAELKQSRDELLNIVANHSTMLHDVVADRQTPGGSKYFVPNVHAIRDDREARRELVDTVVQGMTRSTGELRIRNDMGTGQSLVINGVDSVYLPAHSERTVTVASGTATTELAGEGTKSWMIGAPNYFQDIVIAPAVRSTVASGGSPWQYDPITGGWWRTLQ